MKRDNGQIFEKIQIVLYILFVSSWFVSSNNHIFRIISIVFAVLFSAMQCVRILRRKNLKIDKSILLYVVFTLWCTLSIIWAKDQDASLKRIQDLVFNSVFLILSYDFFSKVRISKKVFISIFIVIGLLFSIYVLGYYGITDYFLLLASGKRVGTEIINVNFIGFVSAITFLIIIFSVVNNIYKNKLPLLLLSIIPLVTSLGSGSKKAILGLAVGMIMIFVFYVMRKLSFKRVIISFLIVVLTIGSFFIIRSLPYFNTVFERMETMFLTLDGDSSVTSESTYLREQYIKEGFETFLDYPVFGIGINNSGQITEDVSARETYLHCNYVELLACVGIVGFLLYYSIYAIILKKGFEKARGSEDMNIVNILLIIMLLLDIGGVSYYEIKTSMYFVLMLVLLEREKWVEICSSEKENVLISEKWEGK